MELSSDKEFYPQSWGLAESQSLDRKKLELVCIVSRLSLQQAALKR